MESILSPLHSPSVTILFIHHTSYIRQYFSYISWTQLNLLVSDIRGENKYCCPQKHDLDMWHSRNLFQSFWNFSKFHATDRQTNRRTKRDVSYHIRITKNLSIYYKNYIVQCKHSKAWEIINSWYSSNNDWYGLSNRLCIRYLYLACNVISWSQIYNIFRWCKPPQAVALCGVRCTVCGVRCTVSQVFLQWLLTSYKGLDSM